MQPHLGLRVAFSAPTDLADRSWLARFFCITSSGEISLAPQKKAQVSCGDMRPGPIPAVPPGPPVWPIGLIVHVRKKPRSRWEGGEDLGPRALETGIANGWSMRTFG